MRRLERETWLVTGSLSQPRGCRTDVADRPSSSAAPSTSQGSQPCVLPLWSLSGITPLSSSHSQEDTPTFPSSFLSCVRRQLPLRPPMFRSQSVPVSPSPYSVELRESLNYNQLLLMTVNATDHQSRYYLTSFLVVPGIQVICQDYRNLE